MVGARCLHGARSRLHGAHSRLHGACLQPHAAACTLLECACSDPRLRTFDSRGMMACSVSPGVACSTVSPFCVLRMIVSTQPWGHLDMSVVSRSRLSPLMSMLRGRRGRRRGRDLGICGCGRRLHAGRKPVLVRAACCAGAGRPRRRSERPQWPPPRHSVPERPCSCFACRMLTVSAHTSC